MKKRGQITAFIIIGLLLLITLLYFTFIREKSLHDVEEIMPELIPVQSYIHTCMSNIGEDAIETIGLNGGYIYFPTDIENNPNTYLSTSPTPKLKNPYWWYDGIERVPPEEFIEDQITQYMEDNLPNCLNNFEAFKNTYQIIEHSPISVITETGESMNSIVKIVTNYNIEIKDKFNKTLAELEKFRVEIPVRLHAVYTLAKTIMERENAQGFVERRVVDLISMDNDVPDTGGPKIQCGKMNWNIQNINAKIRMLMSENFPFIKIKGTEFPHDRYIPLPAIDRLTGTPLHNYFNESYYWSHFIWDVGEGEWNNMRVSFTYDYKWPLYWGKDLYIRPNEYPLLFSNSQKAAGIMNFLCIHLWHFTYDLKFPVKVTISDEKTIKHDDYSFIYTFKGSIDHNEPKRDSFNIIDYKSDNAVEDEEYCSDPYNNIMIMAIENTTTGHEINNVNLTFVCGPYKCNLGSTKPNYRDVAGGTPYWDGPTPTCTLALIKAKKEGFADVQKLITPKEDGIYTIHMDPIKEFKNFTVVKRQYISETLHSAPAQALSGDESALIMLKAKDKTFEQTVIFPFNETTSLGESQTLKLLENDDHIYDLEIYLMDNDTIIGGYTGEWQIDKEDLIDAKVIEFQTIFKQNFADDNDLAFFFGDLKRHSLKVMPPELKK